MSVAWETFVDKFINQGGYKLTLTGLTNTALIAVFGLLIGFLLGSVIAVVKLIPTNKIFITILKNVSFVQLFELYFS